MAYEYDVFVSYPRRGRLPEWVRNVFQPQLQRSLEDAGLGWAPRVFVDQLQIAPGEIWPELLANAHHRSRLVVAVLAGPYFESGWCTSEWKNALAREDALAAAGERPIVLLPLRYNDTTDEDVEAIADPAVRGQVRAKARQDFGRFANLVNPTADTERAFEFREAVSELCERLLKPALRRSPAWDATWPRLPALPVSGRDPSWSPR